MSDLPVPRHALAELFVGPSRSWPNWLGRWASPRALTFEEYLGLLKTGLQATDSPREHLVKISFYLRVADGYSQPILHPAEEEYNAQHPSAGIPGAAHARQELALAAMRQLTRHIFVPSGNRRYPTALQSAMLADDKLREELLWFFRPTEGYTGISNFTSVARFFKDDELDQIRRFIFQMIDFIWMADDPKTSWLRNDAAKKRVVEGRPKLVGLLAGLGRLRILQSPEYTMTREARLVLAEICLAGFESPPTFGITAGHYERLPEGSARDAAAILLLREPK